MEDTHEHEELSKQCSSLAGKIHDNQDFSITSQALVNKELSAIDIPCENKSTIQLEKKNIATRTPKKGLNTKSPSKGLKRTPKKNLLKIKASFTTPKKRRLQDDNTSHDLQLKRMKKEDGKNEGNDDDEWQDLVDAEESENLNVDLALEQKASKVKMNAKNVKSVIHHVLTNEHVLNMFKSVLESENCDISQKAPETPKKSFTPEKLECFPKLTRAKVKDLLEKVCVPSPMKSTRDGASILEVEFAEEEDDDEYNPEKDEECRESDDDESLVSSQLSEFGSPYPATPSTPVTRNAQEESLSLTPVQLAQEENLHLGTPRNLVSAFNKSMDSVAEEEYRVDTIALRTRSKLPLTSTSITEIESAFVAPDITPDMYDNTYEDADWAQFLSSLCKPSDETITDDDTDANDPEFNYIAEAEREQLDEEDFRFDKPTQITKKELSNLLNELNDMFEDEILPYHVVASVPDMSSQNMEQLKYNGGTCHMQDFGSTSSATYVEFKAPQPLHQPIDTSHQQQIAACSYPMNQPFIEEQQQQFNEEEFNNNCQAVESLFTPEQIALVEDNLRKHVQLLIQSFLLLQGKEFKIENATSPKAMLSELETLRHDSPLGERSIYNICNLDPSLQLLKDGSLFLPEKPVQQKPGVIQWKPAEVQCTLTEVQQRAVYNSSAFVYPSLLPSLNKGKKKADRKYNKFLQSEDNLIALGLEQFQYCRNVNPVELIHRFLIRGKNANQIHFRIQFMSSPKVGDNPIKSVKKTGQLPIDFLKPVVDDYFPVPPKDQISDNLPIWCLSLKETGKRNASKNQLTGSAKPPVSAVVSTSKRKSKKIKLSSEVLNESRTQALPTIILPSSMAPVSGIFIQFGPTSTFGTSNQATIGSPFAAKAHNILAVTNSDSCSSCTLKPVSPTSSQTEQCLPTSTQKELTDGTAGIEESPQNAIPSSPDVLTKTMISCGIQESPELTLSLSPCGSETMTTSTPHQAQNKHPIVRNLSSAFDAAHNASRKSNAGTKSRLQQHNPGSAEAGVASSQTENKEKNKSSFESDGDSTVRADTGGALMYNSGGDQEAIMHSPHGLSDSVSDYEPNLVIEESHVSSSQENVLPKPTHQVCSSLGTDSSTNNPSHQFTSTNQETSLASSNFSASPTKASDLTNNSQNGSKKENSKARSKKQSQVAESSNDDNSNPISSHVSLSMKEMEAKTPTKMRSLVPKPETPSSPYIPLPKISPRRKELNKQVRQILPKSFVFEAKSPSPTKAAALVLKKKATMLCQQRSPVKLLPKSPQPSELLSNSRPRVTLTPSRMYTRSQHTKTKNTASTVSSQCSHEDNKQDKVKLKDVAREDLSGGEEPNLSQEEEEEDEAFGEDDQIQLEDLMAASTTIRYDPKKGNSMDSDTKTKSQRKKDVCLAMLDPDIIECDPKKDERDTAYAQYYFNCVKEVLKDDPERFRKFLCLLHSQNKDHCNPIELYADLATLLSDHQDLVDDFAGFLLSFQAVECQCFVSSIEYQQIRSFLRQLEIYCDMSTLTFQRTLKMMSKWLTLNQDAQTDTSPFKDRIASVLRHVPGLMDDLLSYFFDAPLPECHPTDFEDVTLDEVFDIGEIDKFEEVTLPDGREEYNTRFCSCKCHNDKCDKKFFKRSKHCISCSLKMFEGKPILKMWRTAYRDVSIIYPLEEKEKLAKAKKEAALIALAKARAQRQQKKKNKKKIRKMRPVETKRKKKNRGKASNNASGKNALTSSDNKNLVECVQEDSADLTRKEIRDNKDSLKQKVLEPKEECVNSIDKDKDDVISDVAEVPVSSLARSTYTSLFLPSATSSPITSKNVVSSGMPHECSLTDSSSHVNTLTEAVNMADSDATMLASAQTPTGSISNSDKGQQKHSQGLEKNKQSSSRSTKSKPKLSQSKKSKTHETPSNPLLVASLVNQLPPTGSPVQQGSLNSALTSVKFPAQTAPLLTAFNTPVIQTRIPVMVYLQPQDSLPETSKTKDDSTKVSSRKSRKKSETNKSAPVTSNKKHVESLKPNDQPSQTTETSAPLPVSPTAEEVHLPKSPISGLALSEPSHLTSNVHQNTDEERMHIEPPGTDETVLNACSSALNKTAMSTVDLHTSDTSSIFHFSPSKFKGKIPDVVRAYLDNFSLGGFDETMDIHVQQLAQAISPGKPGTNSSRFNLLAYLDSSNLTLKDGTSMNLGKSENEKETRISFSGALSEAVPSSSEKCLDLTTQAERLHTKDSSVIHAEPLGTSSGFQSSPESKDLKEKPGMITKAEVVSDSEDLEEWSEDSDRFILNIVAVDGITSISLNKIQQLIPDKSVTEIHARANLLLQMLQTVGDSESDTGTSCDDSSNM